MLPLTEENVASLFKTGVLTFKSVIYHEDLSHYCSFGQLLGVPDHLISNPLSAASWWVRHGKDRRWRVIIYYLDDVGETGIADELMSYSEPPLGV